MSQPGPFIIAAFPADSILLCVRWYVRCSLSPLKLSGKRAIIEDMCSRFEMIGACHAHYAYLLRAKRR